MPALLGAAIVATAAATPAGAGWPDTPLARAEALAALQTLDADLLAHDSATLVLEDWCRRHALAGPEARIVAERVRDAETPADAAVRATLGVDAVEAIQHRRVRLRCGARILSDADNWYLPARLTPAMNATLAASDTSFGRVVAPLRFRRHTLAARLLWSPLPDGWDMRAAPIPPATGGTLAIPEHVLEHRALLSLPDGAPLALVVERYRGETLDFPAP